MAGVKCPLFVPFYFRSGSEPARWSHLTRPADVSQEAAADGRRGIVHRQQVAARSRLGGGQPGFSLNTEIGGMAMRNGRSNHNSFISAPALCKYGVS